MTVVPAFSSHQALASRVRDTGLAAFGALSTRSRAERLASVHTFSGITALLVVGIAVAITTTPDPLWWHLHFSRLGTFSVFSGATFNGTLMGVGTLIMVLAWRVRTELSDHCERTNSHRRTPIILSLLVASMGGHLAVVGMIPVDTLTFAHEWAAAGITLSFAALLVLAPSLLRGTDRTLLRRTLPAGFVLVGGFTAMTMGLINLAAFELMGFTAMFTWMTLFLGCLTPRKSAAPATAETASVDEALPSRTHVIVRAGAAFAPHRGNPTACVDHMVQHRHIARDHFAPRPLEARDDTAPTCITMVPARANALVAPMRPRGRARTGRGPAPAMTRPQVDLRSARALHPAMMRQPALLG